MERLLSFRGEVVERCPSEAVSLSLGGDVDMWGGGEVAPLRGGKVERPEAER